MKQEERPQHSSHLNNILLNQIEPNETRCKANLNETTNRAKLKLCELVETDKEMKRDIRNLVYELE